jgi:hypothetical protein
VLVSNAIDFTLLMASHVSARLSLTLLWHYLLRQVSLFLKSTALCSSLRVPRGYVSPREALQRPRVVEPRHAGILQEPPPTTLTPTQRPPSRTLTTCNLTSQLLSPHPPPPLPPSRPALLHATASPSPPILFYLSACFHCSSPVTAPPRSPPLSRRRRRTAYSSKI